MAKKFNKTPVTITGSDGTPVTGYAQKQKPSVATALANGNLSNKEALKISKSTGKSLEEIMNKAVSKGGTLGSNLVNKYNSGPQSSQSAYADMVSQSFGGGSGGSKMARLIDPIGSSSIMEKVRSAGTLDKGSSLFIGSKGSTSTVLPKSMMSGSGAKSTAPTIDATPPATSAPSSNTPSGGNTTGSDGLAAASASPADPFMMGPGGMSSDLDGGAKGFRKNRSSARKAGMTTKGTGQFKISMAQGAKTGLNIGY